MIFWARLKKSANRGLSHKNVQWFKNLLPVNECIGYGEYSKNNNYGAWDSVDPEESFKSKLTTKNICQRWKNEIPTESSSRDSQYDDKIGKIFQYMAVWYHVYAREEGYEYKNV